MKNRNMKILIGFMLIMLVFLMSCENSTPDVTPTNSTEKQLESFTMQCAISHPGPPHNLIAVYAEEPWKEYIEKITEGRVKVEMHYDSTLVPPPDLYRALETGVTHMAWIWPPLTPGAFPLMEVFTLPGLMTNWAVSNVVIRDIFEKYPEYREQFSDDVVYLTSMVHMQSDLHLRDPISSLNDLAGKTIGTTSDEGAKALTLLGINSTLLTGPDLYMGLERGVVDGALAAWGWAQAFNLHDVAPYHVSLRISPGNSVWFYNREAFDKFSKLEQLALLEYGSTIQLNMNKANIYTSAKYRSQIPDEHFIDLPKEDLERMGELFEPAWEDWVKRVEGLGYPGSEIMNDIQRLVEWYTYE